MALTKEFTDELTALLNKHGQDTACNTPDYILAGHIGLTLLGVQALNVDRDKWFGFKLPWDKLEEGAEVEEGAEDADPH